MCFAEEYWDGKHTVPTKQTEPTKKLKRRTDEDYGCKIGCCRKMRGFSFFIVLHVINIFAHALCYSAIERNTELENCRADQIKLLDNIATNFLTDPAPWIDAKAKAEPCTTPPTQEKIRTIFGDPALYKNCDFNDYKAYLKEGFYGTMETLPAFSTLGNPGDDDKAFTDEACPNEWGIMGSAFFVTTVATTVGYGNTAPLTQAGRIFFMCTCLPCIMVGAMMVAAVGGLMKFLFDAMGEAVSRGCKKESAWKEVEKGKDGEIIDANIVDPKHGNCTPWVCEGACSGGLNCKCEWKGRVIPAFCGNFAKIVFIGLIYFLAPALVYQQLNGSGDGWTFAQALYFQMVSATTVGFGDLTIKYSDNDGIRGANGGQTWFHLLNTIFLYAGLGVFVAYMGDLTETFGRFKNYMSNCIRCDQTQHLPCACKMSDGQKWKFLYNEEEFASNQWKPEDEVVEYYLLKQKKELIEMKENWDEAKDELGFEWPKDDEEKSTEKKLEEELTKIDREEINPPKQVPTTKKDQTEDSQAEEQSEYGEV